VFTTDRSPFELEASLRFNNLAIFFRFDLTSKFLTYKLGSAACQLGAFSTRSGSFATQLGISLINEEDVNQVCWYGTVELILTLY
jgi:hypothetical protein